MKALRPPRSAPPSAAPARELAELRTRLADAEETVRAIRSGEVDAVVVAGKQGPQVFTLQGAGHAYRVLIESMNEGALIVTADKMILYANTCFARMVKSPLEQVMGRSFHRFLSSDDRAILRPLVQQPAHAGAKVQVVLHAGDGSRLPVQISIRPLAKNGLSGPTVGMVVTDMTEARRSEAMLRALTHRVVQVQEAERGRVAIQLHDNITQLLCGLLFRSQALADKLKTRDGRLKQEATKLRELLGKAAEEVERISRNLRPSVLDQLGLVAALQATSTEFTNRTGVSVKLSCVEPSMRLPADSELALYRILQEALRNVEQHARIGHVSVRLSVEGDFVQLTIHDKGVGFDPGRRPADRKGEGGLGLLGMRERAAYVGGVLVVNSAPRTGTEIVARVPAPVAVAIAKPRAGKRRAGGKSGLMPRSARQKRSIAV